MNQKIRQYFDAVEVRLIESQAFVSYQIIGKEISFTDGKMRVKAFLFNDDIFEFFIYMSELNQQLFLERYSFHWQDKDGHLIIRMDNAPHFPDLPFTPHHVHKGSEVVEALPEPPELLSFLDEIEKTL